MENSPKTNTDGGASIGNDVNVGNDFIGRDQINTNIYNYNHVTPDKDKSSRQPRNRNTSSSRDRSKAIKPQTNREAVKTELRQNLLKQIASELTLAKCVLWLQITVIVLAGLSLFFYTADEFSPLAIFAIMSPLLILLIRYFQAGSVLRARVRRSGFEDLPLKDQISIRTTIKDDAKVGIWYWDKYIRSPLDRALRVEKKPRWRKWH